MLSKEELDTPEQVALSKHLDKKPIEWLLCMVMNPITKTSHLLTVLPMSVYERVLHEAELRSSSDELMKDASEILAITIDYMKKCMLVANVQMERKGLTSVPVNRTTEPLNGSN